MSRKCQKCQITMVKGQALKTTFTSGMTDFIGDKSEDAMVTISPGGSGQMVDVWKCPQCGYSVTR